jgi:drug/metabolite transporter (DMT)-like permease
MGSMKPNEWGLLVILSLLWGGSFFFIEIALRDFQPFTLVFLRKAISRK